jgi:hypothetical protein
MSNETSETAAANEAKPESETVLSQEELDALAETYTKNFGRQDERKDNAVQAIIEQLNDLSGNNSILGLDMLCLALYTYILNCADQRVGFYPKGVQNVLEMVLESYKQNPATVAFAETDASEK